MTRTKPSEILVVDPSRERRWELLWLLAPRSWNINTLSSEDRWDEPGTVPDVWVVHAPGNEQAARQLVRDGRKVIVISPDPVEGVTACLRPDELDRIAETVTQLLAS